MTSSSHPRGLCHLQGQASGPGLLLLAVNSPAEQRLTRLDHYNVVRRGVACPWLQAWLWVKSFLFPYLCGRDTLLEGSLLFPFVGCWATGLEINTSRSVVVLSQRGLQKRVLNLRLPLTGKQALGFLGRRHSVVYGTKATV